MSAGERITELLAEALERLEDGGEEALERFLTAHGTEADELRSQIRDLRGLGMLDAPPEAGPTHERLGEYVLLERLGVGGMGVVYRAEQPSLRREVALKLIRPEHLFFPESRQRFQREVEAVARLEHPCIVRVYEAAQADRLPYFTMELVRGVPLSRVLRYLEERGIARPDDRVLRDVLAALRGGSDGELPLFQPRGRSWVELCFRWAKELAEALSYAHGAGVLHRDIKPSNIMLTWDGRVMLLDFGLASTREGARITRSGAVLGSLAYMAPEQVRGDADAGSPRTDVYSLGVVLYEMLSLRHPFQDEGSNVDQVSRRILEGDVRRLRDRGQSIPWDAETVCLAALERAPERRYPDAAAFARDLDNVLGFRPIEARRPGPLLRLRRFTQRHPAASVGVLLGLVLVVGGPLGLWRAQVARTRAVRAEQQRTERALLEVQRQRDEVTRQKELAARRFELAIQAVADVSDQIAFVELRDVPEAGPVRHQLLDITSRSAERLLDEIPDHVQARKMSSRIKLNRGVVFLEQDRYDLATPLLEEAAAELEALWEEDPADLRLAHQVGICLMDLGVADDDRGQHDRAEERYRASMEVLGRALERAGPGAVANDLRHQMASCLLNLGSLLAKREGAQGTGLAALLEARSIIEAAIEQTLASAIAACSR